VTSGATRGGVTNASRPGTSSQGGRFLYAGARLEGVLAKHDVLPAFGHRFGVLLLRGCRHVMTRFPPRLRD